MLLASRSPLDNAVALFEKAKSEKDVPYATDAPILGHEAIIDDMDSLENRYVRGIAGGLAGAVDRLLPKIDSVLGSDHPDKLKALEDVTWDGSVVTHKALKALWNDAWDLGRTHATQELNTHLYEKGSQSKFSFGRNHKMARFNVDDENVPIAYPPDYGMPLYASNLEEAVDQRTLKLANDVTFKTAAEIQSAIKESVKNHPGGQAIPPSERNRLVSKINLALGRQSRREILSKDKDVGDPLVATQRVGPVMTSRARVIARTELSAAYNLGRINVYTEAGIRYVRWQAVGDLRTCDICLTRNGTIHELDEVLMQTGFAYNDIYDPSEYVIPAHPNDRCHWEPIYEEDDEELLDDEGRDPHKREIQENRPGWAQLGIAGAVLHGLSQRERKRQPNPEKERGKEAQKLFGMLLLGAGVGVLSLSVLYLLSRRMQTEETTVPDAVQESGAIVPTSSGEMVPLKSSDTSGVSVTPSLPRPSSQNEQLALPAGVTIPSPQRQALPDNLPGLPSAKHAEGVNVQPLPKYLLSAEEAKKYPLLLKARDPIPSISAEEFRKYGLSKKDIQALTQRARKFSSQLRQPLEQKLPPALLPSELLARYPELRDIPDIRQITVDDLVKAGVERGTVSGKIQSFIRRHFQNTLSLPPVIVGQSTFVGGINLAIAAPDAILQVLPPNLNNRRQVAESIAAYMKEQAILGTPVRDVGELTAVPGVGKKTIRNFRAQQFSPNINSTLLSPVRDESVIEQMASTLGIGPKKAQAIVDEFRNSGQYQNVDDIITRIRRRLDGTRLHLSDAEEQAIRRSLEGRVFPIPSMNVGQAITQVESQPLGVADIELTRITGRTANPNQLPAQEDIRQIMGATEAQRITGSGDYPQLPIASSASRRNEVEPDPWETSDRERRIQRIQARVRRQQFPAAKSPIITPNVRAIQRRNQNIYEDRVDNFVSQANQYKNEFIQALQDSPYIRRILVGDTSIQEAWETNVNIARRSQRESLRNIGRLGRYTSDAIDKIEQIVGDIEEINQGISDGDKAAFRKLNQHKQSLIRLLRETAPDPAREEQRLRSVHDELVRVREKARQVAIEQKKKGRDARASLHDLADSAIADDLDAGDEFRARLEELKGQVAGLDQELDSPEVEYLERMDARIADIEQRLESISGRSTRELFARYQMTRERLRETRERLRSVERKAKERQRSMDDIDRLESRVRVASSGLSVVQKRLDKHKKEVGNLKEEVLRGAIPPDSGFSRISGTLNASARRIREHSGELTRVEGMANAYLSSEGLPPADLIRLRDVIRASQERRHKFAEQQQELNQYISDFNAVNDIRLQYEEYKKASQFTRDALLRFTQTASKQIRDTRTQLGNLPEQPVEGRIFNNRTEFRRFLREYDQTVTAREYFDTKEPHIRGTYEMEPQYLELAERSRLGDIPEIDAYPPAVKAFYQRSLQRLDEMEAAYRSYVRRRDEIKDAVDISPTGGLTVAENPHDKEVVQYLKESREQAHQAYSEFLREFQKTMPQGVQRSRQIEESLNNALRQLPNPLGSGEDYVDSAREYREARRRIEDGERQLDKIKDQAKEAGKRQTRKLNQEMSGIERELALLEDQAKRSAGQLWDSQIYREGGVRAETLARLQQEMSELESRFNAIEQARDQVPWDQNVRESSNRQLDFLRERIGRVSQDIREVRGLTTEEEDALFSLSSAFMTVARFTQLHDTSLNTKYIRQKLAKLRIKRLRK